MMARLGQIQLLSKAKDEAAAQHKQEQNELKNQITALSAKLKETEDGSKSLQDELEKARDDMKRSEADLQTARTDLQGLRTTFSGEFSAMLLWFFECTEICSYSSRVFCS